MFSTDSKSGASWGGVIFFLILFWFFTGGNFNRAYGSQRDVCADAKSLADHDCMVGRNFEVLKGNMETAFREVINQNNVNTASILAGQKDLYIQQLERENTKLYIDGKYDQTLNAMQIYNAELNRRLDGISAEMLRRPPVYPTTCVPCSTNCCGNGCGSF